MKVYVDFCKSCYSQEHIQAMQFLIENCTGISYIQKVQPTKWIVNTTYSSVVQALNGLSRADCICVCDEEDFNCATEEDLLEDDEVVEDEEDTDEWMRAGTVSALLR